ncbi:MAG: hypothetical protein OEM01_05145 [Desulfobulbaceae bacterium]|nr:hypothetical protein [Desulfobulbaceae bacterium]
MKGKIAWLVPYPIEGSGGHRTIFSHIRNLSDRGHQCHVYIGEDRQQNMSEGALERMVNEFYGSCSAHIHSGYTVDDRFDIAIATAWWTAELVAQKVEAQHKLYFVQDFEPCFNPMGDNYIRAENSYRQGLLPITIGRWLSHLLRDRYGSKANYFDFTADTATYYHEESIAQEPAVCFVYQPEKPRRCSGIGKDTLAIVKQQCPEIKIYTYGSLKEPNYYFDHTHLGILSQKDCNALYNRCMVGLCLSSSNPSRIPFEMMATGLPVVDFYGDNTKYDLPEKGVLLTERDPSSLAGALIKILRSQDLQHEMREQGQRFIMERSAELEFEQCATLIESILAEENILEEEILPLYTSPPFTADYSVPSEPLIVSDIEQTQNVIRSSLCQRLCQNRIGRVLKVLWRGYY